MTRTRAGARDESAPLAAIATWSAHPRTRSPATATRHLRVLEIAVQDAPAILITIFRAANSPSTPPRIANHRRLIDGVTGVDRHSDRLQSALSGSTADDEMSKTEQSATIVPW